MPGPRILASIIVEEEVLVAWVESEDETRALIATNADLLLAPPPDGGHAIVLARLAALTQTVMVEQVADSWRLRALRSAGDEPVECVSASAQRLARRLTVALHTRTGGCRRCDGLTCGHAS